MTSAGGRLSGRRILVTGADGFIGRRLVRLLEARGAEVQRLDARRPKPPDPPADLIFHLAGLANASRCDEDPAGAFEANVALVQRMLEYCQAHRVGVFVLPSTGLIYGDRLKRPAREEDAPRVGGLYPSTKLAAEALLAGACARFRMAGVAARLGNVYGPGVSDATVAGKVIAQLKKRLVPKVRDPRPVRDFLFVDDAAEGLIRLASATRFGEILVVNVSTGRGASVADLIEAGRRAAGLPARRVPPARGPALVLDNRRLVRLTRWRPSTSLRQGLAACLQATDGQNP